MFEEYYSFCSDMMDILREKRLGILSGDELDECFEQWEKEVAIFMAAEQLKGDQDD